MPCHTFDDLAARHRVDRFEPGSHNCQHVSAEFCHLLAAEIRQVDGSVEEALSQACKTIEDRSLTLQNEVEDGSVFASLADFSYELWRPLKAYFQGAQSDEQRPLVSLVHIGAEETMDRQKQQTNSLLQAQQRDEKRVETTTTTAASSTNRMFSIQSPCEYFSQTQNNDSLTLKSARVVWYPLPGIRNLPFIELMPHGCQNTTERAFDVGWRTGLFHALWELDFGQDRHWYIDMETPGLHYAAQPFWQCTNRSLFSVSGHELQCDAFDDFAERHSGLEFALGSHNCLQVALEFCDVLADKIHKIANSTDRDLVQNCELLRQRLLVSADHKGFEGPSSWLPRFLDTTFPRVDDFITHFFGESEHWEEARSNSRHGDDDNTQESSVESNSRSEQATTIALLDTDPIENSTLIQSPCQYFSETTNFSVNLESATAIWYPLPAIRLAPHIDPRPRNCTNTTDLAFDIAWKTGAFHILWELDFGHGRYWYLDLEEPGLHYAPKPWWYCPNRTLFTVQGHGLSCDTFDNLAMRHADVTWSLGSHNCQQLSSEFCHLLNDAVQKSSSGQSDFDLQQKCRELDEILFVSSKEVEEGSYWGWVLDAAVPLWKYLFSLGAVPKGLILKYSFDLSHWSVYDFFSFAPISGKIKSFEDRVSYLLPMASSRAVVFQLTLASYIHSEVLNADSSSMICRHYFFEFGLFACLEVIFRLCIPRLC